MCMVVFAASDKPLPIVRSDDSFLFQAHPLLSGSEAVLRLFSKPYVYDLTSVGGCACGFAYSPDDLEIFSEADVPAEVKQKATENHHMSVGSVRLLHNFLRVAAGTGTAEVYSCWSGDEGLEPETRMDVTLDHFEGDGFSFVQRQFLRVSRE